MSGSRRISWRPVAAALPWRRRLLERQEPDDRYLFHQPAVTVRHVRCRPGRSAGVERRIRRVRPSADDGGGDPRGGGRISAPASKSCGRMAARRGVSRADLRHLYRRPDARSPDHGSARRPARVHQVVLGLSRHAGERGAHQATGARCWRNTARPSMRSRTRLWRRPPYHRRDLGRGIELRHDRRRPPGPPLDRDAGLRRAPAELFPRRIPGDAGNSASRRRAARTASRARGPARSARPSSCRRRSSASRSISTATAAATSSIRCPISSPPPPTISRRTAGSPGQSWGYEVVVPPGLQFPAGRPLAAR